MHEERKMSLQEMINDVHNSIMHDNAHVATQILCSRFLMNNELFNELTDAFAGVRPVVLVTTGTQAVVTARRVDANPLAANSWVRRALVQIKAQGAVGGVHCVPT